MNNFISVCHAVWALIIKEFQIIWSDPKNRAMILCPPVLMLAIFAFAATFEVNNISMLIYDKDNTQISRALVDKLANTPYFKHIKMIDNPADLRKKIDNEEAVAALVIPQNFAQSIYSEEQPLTPCEDDSISCKTDCVCPPGTKRKCTARRAIPGSTAFVPSVAGLILAGEVIRDLAL